MSELAAVPRPLSVTLPVPASSGGRAFVTRHPLSCYFALAYVLSWSYWVPLALSGKVVIVGDGSPTHFPGLLGPLIASFAVTGITRGREGYRSLFASMVRWRVGSRWYAAVAAPLAFYAVTLVALAAAGKGWPTASELSRYSGLPDVGVLWVFLIALAVNGFGEEAGWRGFALPQLQRRHQPLVASLMLSAGWALWHLPLFFVLDSFRGFTPVTLPGFVLGITCGAIILTWVYNGTGGSVLLVALWHITYNMTSATEAAKGTVAAVVSTFVMIWAIALVVLELTAVRRGRPAPLRWRDPPVPRPYALRNRTVNLVVRAVLASPLHRLLSGSVLLLTYEGVRSGRRHTLPVQYSRDGGCITVLAADSVHKRWWRSLNHQGSVMLRVAGADVSASGGVVVDPELGTQLVGSYVARFPRAKRLANGAEVLCFTPIPTPDLSRR
jgi:membrane protease YdiL (CAAX protease family)